MDDLAPGPDRRVSIHPTWERPGNRLGSRRHAPNWSSMGHEESISTLRARVSALVAQEGALLTQAFDLGRGADDRRGVDALFARVQAIQVERHSLQKQIGHILGAHRLHVASEVWRAGVYDYCEGVRCDSLRVRVTKGPLGLQVHFPDRRDAVRIDTLAGTFDGPLAVDDAAAHREAAAQRPARAPEGTEARARRRTATK